MIGLPIHQIVSAVETKNQVYKPLHEPFGRCKLQAPQVFWETSQPVAAPVNCKGVLKGFR